MVVKKLLKVSAMVEGSDVTELLIFKDILLFEFLDLMISLTPSHIFLRLPECSMKYRESSELFYLHE